MKNSEKKPNTVLNEINLFFGTTLNKFILVIANIILSKFRFSKINLDLKWKEKQKNNEAFCKVIAKLKGNYKF